MFKIIKAEKLAEKIYLMEVEVPRVARVCQPREFIIVKIDEGGERIPLTICNYDRENGTVTIVFQIVGASTLRMSSMSACDSFQDFVGPLGKPSTFIKEDVGVVKARKYANASHVLVKYSVTYPSTGRQAEGTLKLGELIEECSDGRMKMEFDPSSQMGDKTATFEGLVNGTIEMTECDATDRSAFNDMWSVFSLHICGKTDSRPVEL